MGQRQSPTEHNLKRPRNRADELRAILRIDWVIYTVIAVVCILALASLHPAVRIDPAIIGTLITFIAGVIGGLFTYLRYRANNKDGENGEE